MCRHTLLCIFVIDPSKIPCLLLLFQVPTPLLYDITKLFMAGLVDCFDVGSLQDVRMMRMTLTCSSEWGLQEAVNWLLMVAQQQNWSTPSFSS